MTLEEFKSDIPANIDFLTVEWEGISNYGDRQFCKQLLDYYEKNKHLTDNQLNFLVSYTNELMEQYNG